MSESVSSNRDVVKVTGIYGAVKIIEIIIGIIRTKVVSVLLGPSGIGVLGLFNQTLSFISSITGLGLSLSAVKDISQAFANNDHNKVAYTVKAFKRLVYGTGLLGLVIVLLGAPFLSLYIFKSYAYTPGFIIVSFSLLFRQLTTSNLVLLKGIRNAKAIAIITVITAVLTLLFVIPMYYFFEEKAIPYNISGAVLIAWLVSLMYNSKVSVKKVSQSISETWLEGKDMIKMGVFMSLGSVLTNGGAFLFRLYINYQAGNDQLGLTQIGLYTAGFSIVETYLGLVFASMSTDYFPRLSQVSGDKDKTTDVLSQQATLAFLIIIPLISTFIVFSEQIVLLLYSNSFLVITEMIKISMIGILFRVLSWSLGFVVLANGKSKVFFYSQLFNASLMLMLNIVFFKLFGLTGIGIAYLIFYIIHLLYNSFIVKITCGILYNKSVYIESMFGAMLVLGVYGATFIEPFVLKVLVIVLFYMATTLFSLYKLNQRLNLKAIVIKITKRFR